jgi:hypothetical protein
MLSGWLRSAEPSGGVYLSEAPAFALLMPGSLLSRSLCRRLAQPFLVKTLPASEFRLRPLIGVIRRS